MALAKLPEVRATRRVASHVHVTPCRASRRLPIPLAPTQGRGGGAEGSRALVAQHQRAPTMPKPKWHPHWKLYRVIAGHTGWVRTVAMEPGNEWFATGRSPPLGACSGRTATGARPVRSPPRCLTAVLSLLAPGSADRTIKIWDLASSQLKLTLTGHISTVRGLAVSARHPYLFSVGEDKTVRCWDLEQNKVIRHYHGHLRYLRRRSFEPGGKEGFTVHMGAAACCRRAFHRSPFSFPPMACSAVYSVALHPTLDILFTGGRDATVRVRAWEALSQGCFFFSFSFFFFFPFPFRVSPIVPACRPACRPCVPLSSPSACPPSRLLAVPPAAPVCAAVSVCPPFL